MQAVLSEVWSHRAAAPLPRVREHLLRKVQQKQNVRPPGGLLLAGAALQDVLRRCRARALEVYSPCPHSRATADWGTPEPGFRPVFRHSDG
jgi:hypothetical protein